ncbi:hypothetical protein NQ317_013211 [Molorchus minor]|uniref:Uncharacterized protein n=1 Tax=Molorchus minor TaxID=1323400 RepID=A0ABQ9J4E0_9CUCU|nr:hypothetical protein NQ317_013211 [Molorchus minor]
MCDWTKRCFGIAGPLTRLKSPGHFLVGSDLYYSDKISHRHIDRQIDITLEMVLIALEDLETDISVI